MYPSDIQPPLGGWGCMASAMRHVGRLAEGYCQGSPTAWADGHLRRATAPPRSAEASRGQGDRDRNAGDG